MKLIILALLAACSPMVYTHGVPNLAHVEGSIWRSGEPTSEGWAYISQLAVGHKVHVIKLNFDAEGSDSAAKQLGFEITYVPIEPQGDQNALDDVIGTFKAPDELSVRAALNMMSTCLVHPDTDFCLVHCTHGQDRTGYVIGRWRVQHDGWTKSKAWHEMLDHHFHWELVGLMDAWEDFHP